MGSKHRRVAFKRKKRTDSSGSSGKAALKRKRNDSSGKAALKRKRTDGFGSYDSEKSLQSVSVCSNFKSEVETMEIWDDKYAPIYLRLLELARYGSYFNTQPLYEIDFWNAFTEKYNKCIKEQFPSDSQFTGFSRPVVISQGVRLRSIYNNHKAKPDELVNFRSYQDCFKGCEGICAKVPVFPNFEARIKNGSDTTANTGSTSTRSSRKRKMLTPFTGGEDYMDLLAARLSYFTVEKVMTTQKLRAVLREFKTDYLTGKTFLDLPEEEQISFLNGMP